MVKYFLLVIPEVTANAHETLMAFYSGIVLFVILFNIFVFFSVKDKIHLYYVFYIATLFGFVLGIEGFSIKWLYPGSVKWNEAFIMTMQSVSIASGLQVMQMFIGQRKSNSIFYHWVNLLKYAICLQAVVIIWFYLFSYKESIFFERFEMATLYASMLLILGSLIEKIIQGNKIAWVYMTGMLFLIAGGTILNLNNNGITHIYFLKPNSVVVGSVVEIVVLTFALTYRYNTDRREKFALQNQLNRQQKEFTFQIMETQEAERKRVAADLHDDLGGTLAAARVYFSALASMNQNESLKSHYDHAKEIIDKACADVRKIAHNLMPSGFSGSSCAAVIQRYTEAFNKSSAINFHFNEIGNPRSLPEDQELHICRIVFELINNIVRHSCATQGSVELNFLEKHLVLQVKDNGRGFNECDWRKMGGHGLRNIQDRVKQLKAELQIENVSGTAVWIKVPLDETIMSLPLTNSDDKSS